MSSIESFTPPWLIEADYSAHPPLPGGLPDGARRIRDMAEARAVG